MDEVGLLEVPQVHEAPVGLHRPLDDDLDEGEDPLEVPLVLLGHGEALGGDDGENGPQNSLVPDLLSSVVVFNCFSLPSACLALTSLGLSVYVNFGRDIWRRRHPWLVPS